MDAHTIKAAKALVIADRARRFDRLIFTFDPAELARAAAFRPSLDPVAPANEPTYGHECA